MTNVIDPVPYYASVAAMHLTFQTFGLELHYSITETCAEQLIKTFFWRVYYNFYFPSL